jgi:hypothetical protein
MSLFALVGGVSNADAQTLNRGGFVSKQSGTVLGTVTWEVCATRTLRSPRCSANRHVDATAAAARGSMR